MWFQLILLTVFVQHSFEAGVTLDSAKTPCVCGDINKSKRVLGGQETTPGKYPWMAEIKQALPATSGSGVEIIDLCGAALLSKDYCLTAAHCFARVNDIRQLVVYLGDHDSTRTDEIASITRTVTSVVKHPKYNTTTQANDIAIIKLSTSVVFQWNIQPICIPPPGLNLFNQELIVTGWGSTEQAGPSSTKLREVTIPVVPTADCKQRYAKTVAVIDQSTICALGPNGTKDACQGDSGGPAAWKCDASHSLAGVVSYGIGCGNEFYPGIYTNVSNYLSWITQNTPGNALCGSQCYPQTAESDCGWANNVPPRRRRVVGGTETTANKYPWVVSIYIFKSNPPSNDAAWTFSGAGSIISRKWILTTAKLVFGLTVDKVMIVVGDYDISILDEPGEQVVFASKIVPHPSYNIPLLANDIALVQLTEPLTYNAFVSPVCLPSTNTISATFSDTYVKLAGWGQISTGGSYATKLREVFLYALSNSQCKQYVGYSTIVTDSMVCTNSDSQRDACLADNGGPLMLQGQSGRFFIVAAQSLFNSKGCGAGNPALNTRITPYLSWIQTTTGVTPASTSDTLPVK